jgi:hypothetical protein
MMLPSDHERNVGIGAAGESSAAFFMGMLQSSHSLPNRIFWEDFGPLIPSK